MIDKQFRDGSVRFQREDGSYSEANPHDHMYSTVTMCATEYFKNGEWLPIHNDSDDESLQIVTT